MKLSYQWLQELVSIQDVATAEQLADKLSRTGIEVEQVAPLAADLSRLVVGLVETVTPHPAADHLHVCTVQVGTQHTAEVEHGVLQIVCGADNVAPQQKVIVALPGARIAGRVKIRKSKLRGVVSNGMICSLQELGIATNVVPKASEDGIFVLPETATIGTDVVSLLTLDDAVLELAPTPNRADALSVLGVAHEVGAIYDQPIQLPQQAAVAQAPQRADQMFQVSVTDSQDVPAYHLFVIESVRVAPSPLWLQMRLMKAGIRPINNVVDVTNYMMLLYGQPMHAFDAAKLAQPHIVTRRAHEGETLVTLDGTLRSLTAETVVITDGQKPIALAGVMGGANSEITAETTTVALEVACFNAQRVRYTSKQTGLRSESSMRFEKGINKATVYEAGVAAAQLIAHLADGVLLQGAVSQDHLSASDVTVTASLARINHVLGVTLSQQQVADILRRLGFSATFTEDSIVVSVPPRRWDIRIEADIIEEVARLYGYDHLPTTLPVTAAVPGQYSAWQRFVRHTRHYWSAAHVVETVNYSLVPEATAQNFTWQTAAAVRLQWPMSEAHAVLRQSLIPSLIAAAQYNVARNNSDLALFEIGRVFLGSADDAQPTESTHLAGLFCGAIQQATWQQEVRRVDFYDVTGLLTEWFARYGLQDRVRYQACQPETHWHPGRTAQIWLDDHIIGMVGQLHPRYAKQLDLKETYVFELDMAPVFAASQQHSVSYQAIPRYPGVKRDLALLVPRTMTHQDIVAIIRTHGGAYLQQVHLFDRYHGTGIDPTQQSLAYRLQFLNPEATLVEEEVQQAMTAISEALLATGLIAIR